MLSLRCQFRHPNGYKLTIEVNRKGLNGNINGRVEVISVQMVFKTLKTVAPGWWQWSPASLLFCSAAQGLCFPTLSIYNLPITWLHLGLLFPFLALPPSSSQMRLFTSSESCSLRALFFGCNRPADINEMNRSQRLEIAFQANVNSF